MMFGNMNLEKLISVKKSFGKLDSEKLISVERSFGKLDLVNFPGTQLVLW